MFTVTKHYRDLPAAHRQPNHEGHCRFIHGHNWGFDITFTCDVLDKNGFVLDLGSLDWIKRWLSARFDHTLLLNKDDPLLQELDLSLQWLNVIEVPNCGVEGLAKYVFDEIQSGLTNTLVGRGVRVIKVVCWEDTKNCATYDVTVT
jgi:6-pyruvoyltetrahydropterin/6-carboxytetrahydropterin synthase